MDGNAAPDKTIPVISEHIVTTPGVCGGKPRIAGHRITVQNIVIWHERGGLTPDEITSQHAGITLADVHAALAFYWDHADEIRAQIQADELLAEQLRPQSPSLLDAKLRESNAAGDSVSP
jgi:uncharacterized protein (DUF433 family)